MITRTLTGIALVVLLGFAVYMGGIVFSVLFMIALCLCVFEIYRALRNADNHPVEWPIWLCVGISIPLFLWTDAAYLVVLLAGVACILTCCHVIFRPKPVLEDLLYSCLPMFNVLMPGMCLLSFQQHPERLMQTYFILMSFGVALMGDTMALFVGKKWGSKPLCPAVSPKKTVEGALGGLAGSVFFALLLTVVYSFFTQTPPLWHMLLLGLIGGVIGQVGDLFASLVKRRCGIKDFGKIFPGHGGMMDRLDSVFFTTLVVYIYYLGLNLG